MVAHASRACRASSDTMRSSTNLTRESLCFSASNATNRVDKVSSTHPSFAAASQLANSSREKDSEWFFAMGPGE